MGECELFDIETSERVAVGVERLSGAGCETGRDARDVEAAGAWGRAGVATMGFTSTRGVAAFVAMAAGGADLGAVAETTLLACPLAYPFAVPFATGAGALARTGGRGMGFLGG